MLISTHCCCPYTSSHYYSSLLFSFHQNIVQHTKTNLQEQQHIQISPVIKYRKSSVFLFTAPSNSLSLMLTDKRRSNRGIGMSHYSIAPLPKSSSSMHPSSRNPHSLQQVQMNDLPFLQSPASYTKPASHTRWHGYTCSRDKEIESSFRRSLSSIHEDRHLRRTHKSRSSSVSDLCDSSSRSYAHSSQGKGQASELSHCRARKAAMEAKEKNEFLVQGILRTSSEFYLSSC